MKLRITKRGIRLYVSKHKYLRVERLLLLVLALVTIVGLPTTLLVSKIKTNISTKETPSIKNVTPIVIKDEIKSNPVVEETQTNEPEVIEEDDDPAPIQQEVIETPVQPVYSNTYETRMTSYYPNDGPGTGSITGSGLGPNDFQVNDKGWYTYQGKLVIATATDYLLKYGWILGEGVHTYRYYNELTLTIDGIDYPAIVLDSCGHAMKSGRIDLFVSGSWAVKDTTITVKK